MICVCVLYVCLGGWEEHSDCVVLSVHTSQTVISRE